jgi:hypothetical protein
MNLSKSGGRRVMIKRYKNVFRDKLLKQIQSLKHEVVFWSDISDVGSARQISRALKDLIEDGFLARIGRGIYAKTKKSKYADEPIIRAGFESACLEALKRLNVQWELGQSIKDYNEGLSQQVPAQIEVRLKSRFRRRLIYGKSRVHFEGNINAK